MQKLLIILALLVFGLTGYAQVNLKIDTVDYYMFSSLSHSNGIYSVDGKQITKDEYLKLSKANNEYDKSIKGIRFVRNRTHNGLLKFTTYEMDQEIGPFGEYINYYENGNVKSIWQFQLPNDSMTNFNTPEGLWVYFNNDGDTIGFKQYKNGLANGKWYARVSDSTYIIKEFKDGFSDGFWSVHRMDEGGGKYHRPYAYHKGFYHSTYTHNENFETFIDKGENVYPYQRGWIEIKKIEYGENRAYINNGEFYILKDGIIIGRKEYKDGELIKNVKYDYR